MWHLIKRRVARFGKTAGARNVHPQESRFHIKLPSPYGGADWVTATLAWSIKPRSVGQTRRIRIHWDRCLWIPELRQDRHALSHDKAGHLSWKARGGRVLTAVARQAVERLPAAARTRLSEQRRQTWIDLQLSTAPLDAGAAALMPARLRALYGDRLPQILPGGPRAGVWAGPAGGEHGGLARLAMVQMDANELGYGRPLRAEDEQRLSLNLSVADLAEPAQGGGTESP